ncbi:hypothetical protein NDU88_002859, partial [Pleurodeles waltl]
LRQRVLRGARAPSLRRASPTAEPQRRGRGVRHRLGPAEDSRQCWPGAEAGADGERRGTNTAVGFRSCARREETLRDKEREKDVLWAQQRLQQSGASGSLKKRSPSSSADRSGKEKTLKCGRKLERENATETDKEGEWEAESETERTD